MKLISELKFLSTDKRFKQFLNKKEQKEFDWYLDFDKRTYNLLKKIIKLIKELNFGKAYTELENIEIRFNKESLFLGKMRSCARGHGLKKEEKLIINAIKRSNKVLDIFKKTGSYVGKGKKEKAVHELNKVFGLLN